MKKFFIVMAMLLFIGSPLIVTFLPSSVIAQDDLDDELDSELEDELDLDDDDDLDDEDDEDFDDEDDFADEDDLDDDLDEDDIDEEEEAIAEAEEELDQQEEATYDDEFEETAAASFVKVLAVDFKANENGGTVVIQTDAEANYTTRENPENNQFIVEINNATLPMQFKRPYNTSEFSGPIGMIQGYQDESSSIARFVFQLKESTAMSVIKEGNSLIVLPGESNLTSSGEVSDISSNPQDAGAYEDAVDYDAIEKDKALQQKTLDDFLTGETKFYGRKISIEIKDGDIRDVFSLISEESGLNLVLSEEVRGNISLKLRKIPWDQALIVIMQTKQLGYIRQGSIIRIAPLKNIREETEQARQVLESQKQLEPLKAKIFPISYAKSKDLEGQVQSFLSGRGKVKADERTNSLVVTDINDVLQKVNLLISRLDTQTPQVLIEGKVVEARETFSQRIGVSYSNLTDSAVAGYQLGAITRGAGGDITGTIGAGESFAAGIIGINFQLDLLENDEHVKVLSSPRIVTLNNEKAVIEQSSQIPIYNINVDDGVVTKSVDYKTVKLSLDVVPQITAEGGVILKMELTREFAGSIDPVAPETGARPLNTRKASTSVLVNNGHTAVIGGIYQSDNAEGSGGLPILKDIPLLGYIFGQKSKAKEKNELLIFLTPRVLNRTKAFQTISGNSMFEKE